MITSDLQVLRGHQWPQKRNASFAIQVSHVWYQNDELNETNSLKEFLTSHMIMANLQGYQWPQK